MNPLFEYDPDIGYRFIPNLKRRIVVPDEGGYLVRTNALGFRNDHEFERGSTTPRLLVFGDSFTAGDHVSNGQRYSDVLETLLPGVEAHNFGLPGTGTDQHFIAYRKLAEGAPCTAVVIAVLVENIRRIASAYRPSEAADGQIEFVPKPYFELVGEELVRRNDPVPRERPTATELEETATVDRGGRYPELRQLVRSLGLQSAVQRLTRYQPTPEYDRVDGPTWRLMRAILLAWRALIPQPVILMPLPLYQHVEGTADARAYRARFAELAQDGDFILHDPLPDLLSYDAATRRSFRFKKDVHPTVAGHRAIALSLQKTLDPIVAASAANKASPDRASPDKASS
jgi:hypothetical protein